MSGIGDSKQEIGMLRPRLHLWRVADDVAPWGGLGHRSARDNLIGISLEHDCLAIDEDSLVVALTGCLPDGEIPTPNFLAVIFSRTKTGVRDVAEKCLGDQALDDFLLPRASAFGLLATHSKIGNTCRDPVECSLVVWAR